MIWDRDQGASWGRPHSLGAGNHVSIVGFGSPKQDFVWILAAGSGITWMQCQQCSAQQNYLWHLQLSQMLRAIFPLVIMTRQILFKWLLCNGNNYPFAL